MKVRLLFALFLVPLGGCAGGLQERSWAYLKSQEVRENGKEAGRLGQQMAQEAIAKGAMDPLDRIENKIYRAYQDAKYPSTVKEEPE